MRLNIVKVDLIIDGKNNFYYTVHRAHRGNRHIEVGRITNYDDEQYMFIPSGNININMSELLEIYLFVQKKNDHLIRIGGWCE